ncbi:MAG: hypothetical protein U0736_01940 [Gemmataceae bacterium]
MSQPAEKRQILVQLDSDPHPSVFDRVVAVDNWGGRAVQLRRR